MNKLCLFGEIVVALLIHIFVESVNIVKVNNSSTLSNYGKELSFIFYVLQSWQEPVPQVFHALNVHKFIIRLTSRF